MVPSSTLAGYTVIGSSGSPDTTSPVRMSKRPSCSGHITW
jgi:hypothetical protein